MPDYTHYPTADAVEVLLRSVGVWPKEAARQPLAQAQAEIGAQGAADAWEEQTAWNPFLMAQDASFETRPFNGTDLDGLLSLQSAAQEIQSVTFDGRTLAAGADYWTLDGHNPDKLTFTPPFVALLFTRAVTRARLPGLLQVTARWGYCQRVPPSAWQQILQGGALFALTSVENVRSTASIGQDGFSKAYDVRPGVITQQNLLTTWDQNFTQAVELFARAAS